MQSIHLLLPFICTICAMVFIWWTRRYVLLSYHNAIYLSSLGWNLAGSFSSQPCQYGPVVWCPTSGSQGAYQECNPILPWSCLCLEDPWFFDNQISLWAFMSVPQMPFASFLWLSSLSRQVCIHSCPALSSLLWRYSIWKVTCRRQRYPHCYGWQLPPLTLVFCWRLPFVLWSSILSSPGVHHIPQNVLLLSFL